MPVNHPREALDTLYGLRNNFLLIGLTGRTGSGCSELAKLFSSKLFSDLNAPTPKRGCESYSNQDRKYKICHEYTKSNWNDFTVIHLSDVILTFLLQKNISDIEKYILLSCGLKIKFGSRRASAIQKRFNDLLATSKTIIGGNYLSSLEGELSKNKAQKKKFYKEVADFYSKITNLRNFLKKKYKKNYYQIFQKFGDNIRTSGDPLVEKIDSKGLYAIPQRVNLIIKILRRHNYLYSKKDFFILDSLRNEMEVSFFKERYSAFYLLAVNTEDKIRQDRLLSLLKLDNESIKKLDQKEYPNSLKEAPEIEKRKKELDKYFSFSSIDIQRCIEVADLYFVNNSGIEDLSRQLIIYLSLIFKPGIVQPTSDERMMQLAYTAKFNSGCISRQVGAVISDSNYSVKAIGWNNSPCGQVSCALRSTEDLYSNDDQAAFSNYEQNDPEFKKELSKIYPNRNLDGLPKSFCFKKVKNSIDNEKNQVHTRSLHAEENAMMQIAKYGGQGIKNGLLYTTASPCELCSKKAYQLHIRKIIYIDPYPGIAIDHILKSGSSQPGLQLFSGVVGMSYFKLYEPFMSYKDELAIYST